MELKDYKQELETEMEDLPEDSEERDNAEQELDEIDELLTTLELF